MFLRGLAACQAAIRSLTPTFPIAKMSSVQVPPIPGAKPFRIALVQLGGVSGDKQANLAHAREMILKAASGMGGPKADFVVLPASSHISKYTVDHLVDCHSIRSVSIRLTDTGTSLNTRKILTLTRILSMTFKVVRAKALGCFRARQKRLAFG